MAAEDRMFSFPSKPRTKGRGEDSPDETSPTFDEFKRTRSEMRKFTSALTKESVEVVGIAEMIDQCDDPVKAAELKRLLAKYTTGSPRKHVSRTPTVPGFAVPLRAAE